MFNKKLRSRKFVPKISIIIVYYKGINLLIKLLNSIKNHGTKYSYEVVVVDNSESGEACALLSSRFETVKYIKSPRNLGYGAGNNLGIKKSSGKYIFILNPDAELTKNSLILNIIILPRIAAALSQCPSNFLNLYLFNWRNFGACI